MLQDVTNRSSKVAFHEAKKQGKKRAVEDGRIIFRPTVYIMFGICQEKIKQFDVIRSSKNVVS